VRKKNGKVRICVNYVRLKRAVRREYHVMPTVDTNLAKLSNAKLFSKLDDRSGFWQIPFSEKSKLLTTFITPVTSVSTDSPLVFLWHANIFRDKCRMCWKVLTELFVIWTIF